MLKKCLSILFLLGVSSNLFALSFLDSIRITLSKNTDILLKKEDIKYYEGLNLKQEGTFDTNLSASTNYGNSNTQYSLYADEGINKDNTVNYDVHLDKNLEYGLALESGITYAESRLNEIGTHAESNTSKIYFSITRPLLKSSDKDIITSDKKLAQYDVDISNYNYKRQVNQSIYNSATAYWSYVLAYKKYYLDIKSEKRAKLLLEETKELISVDTKPKSDELQPLASYNSKILNALTTKQNLKNSKYTLGTNLGITLIDVNYIKKPTDTFPIPSDDVLIKLKDKKRFYNMGLQNRMDLKVYELNLKKMQLNKKVAKDQMQGDLDLKFSVDYTGVANDEGVNNSISNLYDNDRSENSGSVSLTYTFPIENSSARGTYIAYNSQLAQNRIKLEEFKRIINIDIDKAIENIKIIVLSYNQIKESVKHYEKAVENEKLKYSLGMSTMLNVIQTTDSLYDEQIRELEALQTYAVQIAQLYFDIGILSDDDTTEFSIDYADFFTIN